MESKETSTEWLHLAVDASAERLEKAGDFTKEESERAKRFLKRNLEAMRADFVHARESIRRSLDPSRISTGFDDLLSHLFGSMGELFQSWAAKSEQALMLNTGEVSGPGKLTCTDCGTELNLQRSSHIPPCPKCHKTDFRKSY
ncbi:MAG: hypothetical protein Q8Q09_00120 [Deltaproteobacteria bacterium]|nr:hypothetical protein [Deltaproteobacteria bacterium]